MINLFYVITAGCIAYGVCEAMEPISRIAGVFTKFVM